MSNQPQENLIPINITIADRSYRVKIAAKDEEAVRKTAALDRKSTRLNSSHVALSRMPSSA